MLGITRKETTHGLMAIGAGLGVFAGEVASITHNAYVTAGCYAAIATLTALGVGIAKRSQP